MNFLVAHSIPITLALPLAISLLVVFAIAHSGTSASHTLLSSVTGLEQIDCLAQLTAAASKSLNDPASGDSPPLHYTNAYTLTVGGPVLDTYAALSALDCRICLSIQDQNYNSPDLPLEVCFLFFHHLAENRFEERRNRRSHRLRRRRGQGQGFLLPGVVQAGSKNRQLHNLFQEPSLDLQSCLRGAWEPADNKSRPRLS